jgi:hypothetical protein
MEKNGIYPVKKAAKTIFAAIKLVAGVGFEPTAFRL